VAVSKIGESLQGKSLGRAEAWNNELKAGDVIFNNYGQVKNQARDQHIAGDFIIN